MTLEGNGSFFNNLMEVLFGWDRKNLKDCGGFFSEGGAAGRDSRSETLAGIPWRTDDGRRWCGVSGKPYIKKLLVPSPLMGEG
jgi:hypothetical protein